MALTYSPGWRQARVEAFRVFWKSLASVELHYKQNQSRTDPETWSGNVITYEGCFIDFKPAAAVNRIYEGIAYGSAGGGGEGRLPFMQMLRTEHLLLRDIGPSLTV